MANYKKKTPRGDATPVKKFKGEYMPVPYGPTQKAKAKKKKRKYAAWWLLCYLLLITTYTT